jgi:hypothetical protein
MPFVTITIDTYLEVVLKIKAMKIVKLGGKSWQTEEQIQF